jgi:Ca2+-transporting ATPase
MLSVGLQLLIIYSPFLHPIFKTTTLGWNIMRMILMVAAGCVVLIELVKLFRKKNFSRA